MHDPNSQVGFDPWEFSERSRTPGRSTLQKNEPHPLGSYFDSNDRATPFAPRGLKGPLTLVHRADGSRGSMRSPKKPLTFAQGLWRLGLSWLVIIFAIAAAVTYL